MILLHTLLFLITGIAIVAAAILLFCLTFNFKTYSRTLDDTPFVSILVAARNEENNISKCIDSLLAIDYPADRYEILVGDDDSSDRTYEIIKGYTDGSPRVKGIHVKEALGKAKGKPNVLAHLAHKAKGEFLFITDADCQVNRNWIHGLLAAYGPGVGIVVGITGVKSMWQNMDWLFALGMIKGLHDLGKPVVTMGNNMCITKEAYEGVGGYESIPFSVTEDLELFKEVNKLGYRTRHAVSGESYVRTEPVKGLTRLFRQRKRWLTGAVQLPLFVVFLLLIQAMYYPSIIVAFFLNWKIALAIFTVKALVQLSIVKSISYKIHTHISAFYLMAFEFYQIAVAMLSSVYFLFPTPIYWKGRKY